jgi:hypothetical protein
LPNIKLKNTLPREIEDIIRFLQTKESHSYDKITTKILKISAPFISSPFAYLLTLWSRVLLEKLTVNFAASEEIPRIYGTRKFLTVPTSAHHLSLS